MRTNIVINDALMNEALKYSKFKTKKDVINQALKDFVDNAKRLSLLEIKGKIQFDDRYNYKNMREDRVFD